MTLHRPTSAPAWLINLLLFLYRLTLPLDGSRRGRGGPLHLQRLHAAEVEDAAAHAAEGDDGSPEHYKVVPAAVEVAVS